MTEIFGLTKNVWQLIRSSYCDQSLMNFRRTYCDGSILDILKYVLWRKYVTEVCNVMEVCMSKVHVTYWSIYLTEVCLTAWVGMSKESMYSGQNMYDLPKYVWLFCDRRMYYLEKDNFWLKYVWCEHVHFVIEEYIVLCNCDRKIYDLPSLY